MPVSNPWDARAYDSTFSFVRQYGDDVLALLDAQPGERILDLGCGTGHHAAALAEGGAIVVGLDADAQMLAKARADHPSVTFVEADAARFGLADLGVMDPFDACFSNAALHWMQPPDRVLANVRGVLAKGARFVAEMGGDGNIAALDRSLRAALVDCDLTDIAVPTNYFPTLGQQAVALEHAGFRVEFATWFRRPTPLADGTSAADWTRHFRAMVWGAVPSDGHDELGQRVDLHAREEGLLSPDGWFADYCRLRFVARAA